MNPLNSIAGTIIAGFVLALVLGLFVNYLEKQPSKKIASTTINK